MLRADFIVKSDNKHEEILPTQHSTMVSWLEHTFRVNKVIRNHHINKRIGLHLPQIQLHILVISDLY